MNRSLAKAVGVVASAAAIGFSASADTVYDNSKTYSGSYITSGNEFGDQIFTVGAATANVIQSFSFEYFGSLTAGASKTGVINFYANDGTTPAGSPGANLWTSPTFTLANGFQTINITGITGVVLPGGIGNSHLTWTVKFSGLSVGESAGLLVYEKPTIGNSNNDYWEKVSGSWVLKQISGGSPAANFGARLVASVPEPSVVQLSLVAGAFMAGFAGFRRFSK